MTKTEAIKRIEFAICELRCHSGSRNRSTTMDAISMPESVIDALEKHLESRSVRGLT